MKQINFETCNYDHKEELKNLVTSMNDLIDKYNKTFSNADTGLKKIESNIDKKNSSIQKLNASSDELTKREEELKELKIASNEEIKELEAKKKCIEFTDSEVQKMEIEDIDTLVAAKKSKIAKIDTKINSTREKIKTNAEAKKTQEKELRELEQEKNKTEESLYKTEAILKLVNTTKETFNLSIKEILDSEYIRPAEPKPEEEILLEEEETEPVIEEIKIEEVKEKELDDDFSVIDFELGDIETVKPEIEEPKNDAKEVEVSTNDSDYTQELSILDFSVIDIPETTEPVKAPEIPEQKEEVQGTDYRALLEDIFTKEAISFSDFNGETQNKMLANADRVIKNVVVLKKHQIPLELTLNQSEIYYAIEPQDLDDLLNIITTDDDGNGMGFTIDYVYYILNELAHIDVDKLIDVYNNEFMNINSKSGIIGLLKLTNPEITDYKENRNINIETLKSLGVTTTEAIEREYPEFVNMDNPLFLNTLNIFDKDDLVDKLNTDIKIVPKILDYWKNN